MQKIAETVSSSVSDLMQKLSDKLFSKPDDSTEPQC